MTDPPCGLRASVFRHEQKCNDARHNFQRHYFAFEWEVNQEEAGRSLTVFYVVRGRKTKAGLAGDKPGQGIERMGRLNLAKCS